MEGISVITGQAEDSDGSPLADVSVTVLGHPEYGTVLTDSEGRFSIPAEGGSVMTAVYRKQGLLTSHRQVYVPWNDIACCQKHCDDFRRHSILDSCVNSDY